MFGFDKKTDYALEVMTYLAQNHNQGPVSLKKIAQEKEMPLKYLEQVVAPLRQAGLIEAKEGRGGGYFLKRLPKDVSVAEIIETLSGPVEASHCFGCAKVDACGQKSVWEEVNDKVRNTMEKKTLADLAK